MPYYAVHKGKKPGIYTTWPACKEQVNQFTYPVYKKFDNEKDAQYFLEHGFQNNKNPVSKKFAIDKKNEKILDEELTLDLEHKIFIYTDGSCIKFPNGLTKAGYGIYIPSKKIKVSEPLLNQKQTNNRAELSAIIKAFDYLTIEEKKKKIIIITDSQYSIYIFKDTGLNYEKNNFMKDGKEVLNKDLIQKALHIKRSYNVQLLKIRAHTSKNDIHTKYNEIVDKLAKDGAYQNKNPNQTAHIFQKRLEPYQDPHYFDNLELEKESEQDNEDNKAHFRTIDHIDKDISMDQMFEHEPLINNKTNNLKNDHFNKLKKNTKLTQWFIKK